MECCNLFEQELLAAEYELSGIYNGNHFDLQLGNDLSSDNLLDWLADFVKLKLCFSSR